MSETDAEAIVDALQVADLMSNILYNLPNRYAFHSDDRIAATRTRLQWDKAKTKAWAALAKARGETP